MTDGPEERDQGGRGSTDFSRTVGAKAARKLLARRDTTHGVWFGLGMMGLVGWSVAVPTLLGALGGLWLDDHHPAPFSWTLALIVAGLMIGCLNAWHWVARERQAIDSIGEDPDD